MKLLTYIYLIFFMTFSSTNVMANFEQGKIKNNLNSCQITKKASSNFEPENFSPGNNLLRSSGQEPIYCGEQIIIHGKVLDENCVPVTNAKVYLWQVGCKGKYPYKPLKNAVDQDFIDIDPNLTFTGNGIATTNNKGEFYFTTVYPHAVHDLAPHVNLRIEHHMLKSLQTKVSLKENLVNYPFDNPELSEIVDYAEQNGISIYDFKIVMQGDTLVSY